MTRAIYHQGLVYQNMAGELDLARRQTNDWAVQHHGKYKFVYPVYSINRHWVIVLII